MDRKSTVQNPSRTSLGGQAQDDIQVSKFSGSDGNYDSDIQSIISSRSGNISEDSETDLESDDESDESNNEVDEDGLDDTSEEESQIFVQEPNHLLVILEKQLDERILENKFAIYTVISPDAAEIWVRGGVTRLHLKDGWPEYDALFNYIEIRQYELVACPSHIYQGARRLLGVGGMIHHVQILSGVSEKSRYDHHKPDMEQEFYVPTGFSFCKVLPLSLKELEPQDLDTGTNHLLHPRDDHNRGKLSINA